MLCPLPRVAHSSQFYSGKATRPWTLAAVGSTCWIFLIAVVPWTPANAAIWKLTVLSGGTEERIESPWNPGAEVDSHRSRGLPGPDNVPGFSSEMRIQMKRAQGRGEKSQEGFPLLLCQ